MRIVLIYPPITKLERYSSAIGHAGGQQIPLGVFYLAAFLRHHGHTPLVLDGEARGLTTETTVAEALNFSPQVIGLSATTVAFHRALEVARVVKAQRPDIPIILGGPHVTAAAQSAMNHTEFDYAVLGEGEVSLGHLLEALERGDDPGTVPGMAYRKGGQVFCTPPRSPIPDLDNLPFPAYDQVTDFSLYNPPPTNYKKLPVVNIITSRGCPNQCTFCGHSAFGRVLRQRSAKNIADEIELLHNKYHAREIAFVDDTFTINIQRIYDLFQQLSRRGLRLPWTCMSRINTVNFEALKFMRDHGCWHIAFGLESGNPDILTRIKKNISLDQARQVIDWCARLGIRTKGFFIVGHPGETLETVDQTIRFARELKLDDILVTLNTPLPATQQYREAHLYGHLGEEDWAKFNMWSPVFVPTGMTSELLLAKQQEFYRRFYLRPRIILRYARSLVSRTGWRRALALGRSLPYLVKTIRGGHKHSDD